eukprot:1145836-Pelagomonas_calceolata.AAC.14
MVAGSVSGKGLRGSSSVLAQVQALDASTTCPATPGAPLHNCYTHFSIEQNVWVDPPCGDGVCDDPYEFPEYSRFGCRADCGLLKEIQNLTQVRISIQHDFSHPSSSIPAAVSGGLGWRKPCV